jgi:hypothetical protein
MPKSVIPQRPGSIGILRIMRMDWAKTLKSQEARTVCPI